MERLHAIKRAEKQLAFHFILEIYGAIICFDYLLNILLSNVYDIRIVLLFRRSFEVTISEWQFICTWLVYTLHIKVNRDNEYSVENICCTFYYISHNESYVTGPVNDFTKRKKNIRYIDGKCIIRVKPTKLTPILIVSVCWWVQQRQKRDVTEERGGYTHAWKRLERRGDKGREINCDLTTGVLAGNW